MSDEDKLRMRAKMLHRRGKSGAAKRTSLQREMDLVDEANLYLRGWTQQQIADWIGEHRDYTLTRETIAVDMKLVRERWQKHYLRDVDEIKSQELARIDRIEQEAWAAWEKSKKDINEVTAVRKTDSWGNGSGKPAYRRDEVTKKTKGRDPSEKFIELVKWCVEKRIQIFGLDAPKTVNVNWRQEALEAGITNPETYMNELANEFVEAARRGSVAGRPDEGGVGESPAED